MLAKWFKVPNYGITVIFIVMITCIVVFLKLPVSLIVQYRTANHECYAPLVLCIG